LWPKILAVCLEVPLSIEDMTYASQQLAEALQKLAHEAEHSQNYSNCCHQVSLDTEDVQFPPAVAEFLENTGKYTEQTKTVSVGIY
jgi:hypothetical protein